MVHILESLVHCVPESVPVITYPELPRNRASSFPPVEPRDYPMKFWRTHIKGSGLLQIQQRGEMTHLKSQMETFAPEVSAD